VKIIQNRNRDRLAGKTRQHRAIGLIRVDEMARARKRLGLKRLAQGGFALCVA